MKAYIHFFFVRTVLWEYEAEKYQKFKNILRTYPRLRKGERTFVWILNKIMEIIGVYIFVLRHFIYYYTTFAGYKCKSKKYWKELCCVPVPPARVAPTN